MLRAGGQHEHAEHVRSVLTKNGTDLIPFSGPPGHYTTVAYRDVIEGRIPASQFRDRYVIVGSWATGLTDTFPTPVSHHANGMAGMEILANLLQAASQQRSLRIASPLQGALACALPVLLLCVVMRHGSPKLSLALNGALLILILPLTALVLRYGQIWFPPSAALFSLALCYPIWSWRSRRLCCTTWMMSSNGYAANTLRCWISVTPPCCLDTGQWKTDSGSSAARLRWSAICVRY